MLRFKKRLRILLKSLNKLFRENKLETTETATAIKYQKARVAELLVLRIAGTLEGLWSRHQSKKASET